MSLLLKTLSGGPTAYTLTALNGSFVESGQNASLLFGRKITPANGSFTESGQSVSLLFGRKLTAANGTFTESGQSITLLNGRKLTANVGAFTETGQAANLYFGRRLNATAGTFTETGFPATLTYTPSGTTYTLIAQFGGFTLTGQAADLLYTPIAPEQPPSTGGISTWFSEDYGQKPAHTMRVVEEEEHVFKYLGYKRAYFSAGSFDLRGCNAHFIRGVSPEQDERDLQDLVEAFMQTF